MSVILKIPNGDYDFIYILGRVDAKWRQVTKSKAKRMSTNTPSNTPSYKNNGRTLSTDQLALIRDSGGDIEVFKTDDSCTFIDFYDFIDIEGCKFTYNLSNFENDIQVSVHINSKKFLESTFWKSCADESFNTVKSIITSCSTVDDINYILNALRDDVNRKLFEIISRFMIMDGNSHLLHEHGNAFTATDIRELMNG